MLEGWGQGILPKSAAHEPIAYTAVLPYGEPEDFFGPHTLLKLENTLPQGLNFRIEIRVNLGMTSKVNFIPRRRNLANFIDLQAKSLILSSFSPLARRKPGNSIPAEGTPKNLKDYSK